MLLSFLHAADIHLDSPLRGLERYENAPVERIRGATRRAFERMIDLAIDTPGRFRADRRRPLRRRLARLQHRALSGPAARPAAGREDPGLHHRRQPRRRQQDDPGPAPARERPRPGPRSARDGPARRPRRGDPRPELRAGPPSPRTWPPPIPTPCPAGSTSACSTRAWAALEGHERYAPCTLEDLRVRGYDYWALGHIHTRQVPCDDPPVVFPGNSQGRHIRETGREGLPAGDHRVGCGASSTVFHRLDVVRWERGRVDVTGPRRPSPTCSTASADDARRPARGPSPTPTACWPSAWSCTARRRCTTGCTPTPSDSSPRSATWPSSGAATGSGSRRSSSRPGPPRP